MLKIVNFVVCSSAALGVFGEYYHLAGTDKRVSEASATTLNALRSDVSCAAGCSREDACSAFNFFEAGVDSKCELLPRDATFVTLFTLPPANGWRFYLDKQSMSYYNSADGTVCMPYEIKAGDTTAPDNPFACTANPYIVDLVRKEGKQNCKFKKEDSADFCGHDIEGYIPLTGVTYREAFERCQEAGCASFVCTNDRCWLKDSTHEKESTSFISSSVLFTYWYATCE